MNWKQHWILIIIPPYYRDGTNDGTLARKNGCQPSRYKNKPDKSGHQSKGYERRNVSQPRTPERKNAG
jgi:hypothetical protein